MRIGTLRDGTADGSLIVVLRDLARDASAFHSHGDLMEKVTLIIADDTCDAEMAAVDLIGHCELEGFAGHKEQADLRVRRFGRRVA
jgi:hypothetical protein